MLDKYNYNEEESGRSDTPVKAIERIKMSWLKDIVDIVDNTASTITIPVKTITKIVKDGVETVCGEDE